MNTRVMYMYRDSENYKKYGEHIINGELSIKELQPFLLSGELFIPSEVGLNDLQTLPLCSYDHVWHELLELNTVCEVADIPLSAELLIKRFKDAYNNNWNQNSVFSRLKLI